MSEKLFHAFTEQIRFPAPEAESVLKAEEEVPLNFIKTRKAFARSLPKAAKALLDIDREGRITHSGDSLSV